MQQGEHAVYLALIVPADLVMSRQMLRGVKKRAEAASRSTPPRGAYC